MDQIIATLGRLKQQVGELDDPAAGHAPDSVQKAASRRVNPDALSLLRAGMAELDTLKQPIEFPAFFSRLADRTGLRMLLLRQWRSGMQICGERNLAVPPEARSRRPDGKAPIPTEPDNLFAAVARERQVYVGPVPIKVFPVDLTLMLGRGAQERRIIVLPIPAREHWNTFVYLDGEPGNDSSLMVAEFLARHAVGCLKLLQGGELMPEGEVAAMLKQELHRRRDRLQKKADLQGQSLDHDVDHPGAGAEQTAAGQAAAARRQEAQGEASTPIPEAGQWACALSPTARRINQAQIQAEEIVKAWEDAVLGGPVKKVSWDPPPAVNPLAPAAILRQSGDLPAMPKAALHILSVIEDPRTTATRLERAVAMDQALTAKILRIANSPFYGAVREIKTVSEAIVRLGFVTIRNWTLVTATKSVFLDGGAGLLFQRIWRQSILSAMSAQLVAQAACRSEPEAVFIGGLMQNIGQLVLARSHLDLFQQVLTIASEEGMPYHLVEQELLGFDHGDLGALLIREWNLSEELEQGVRWHHRLDHPDVQCRDLAAMIALGEEVAACTGLDEGNESDELRHQQSRAAAVLGISAAGFGRLREEARHLSIDPGLFA